MTTTLTSMIVNQTTSNLNLMVNGSNNNNNDTNTFSFSLNNNNNYKKIKIEDVKMVRTEDYESGSSNDGTILTAWIGLAILLCSIVCILSFVFVYDRIIKKKFFGRKNNGDDDNNDDNINEKNIEKNNEKEIKIEKATKPEKNGNMEKDIRNDNNNNVLDFEKSDLPDDQRRNQNNNNQKSELEKPQMHATITIEPEQTMMKSNSIIKSIGELNKIKEEEEKKEIKKSLNLISETWTTTLAETATTTATTTTTMTSNVRKRQEKVDEQTGDEVELKPLN